eukprot:5020318-Amphidinium_carterae.1
MVVTHTKRRRQDPSISLFTLTPRRQGTVKAQPLGGRFVHLVSAGLRQADGGLQCGDRPAHAGILKGVALRSGIVVEVPALANTSRSSRTKYMQKVLTDSS